MAPRYSGIVNEVAAQAAPLIGPADLATLARVFAGEPDVLVAYLFGSAASGKAGPLSDIDLAVLLRGGSEPAVAARRRLRLSRIAAGALADDRIDLVVLNTAPPDLAFRVVRDGAVVICTDEPERLAFEVRTIDRYLDILPFYAVQDSGLAARMRDDRYGRL
ncbi:MAG: nucleotidyltransferase domain-containing protein [Acidobacteria bacterium]|nr:nucleotidyltransferase domain-containing protein [Acidobacteriota bacterium]